LVSYQKLNAAQNFTNLHQTAQSDIPFFGNDKVHHEFFFAIHHIKKKGVRNSLKQEEAYRLPQKQ